MHVIHYILHIQKSWWSLDITIVNSENIAFAIITTSYFWECYPEICCKIIKGCSKPYIVHCFKPIALLHPLCFSILFTQFFNKDLLCTDTVSYLYLNFNNVVNQMLIAYFPWASTGTFGRKMLKEYCTYWQKIVLVLYELHNNVRPAYLCMQSYYFIQIIIFQ